MLLRDGRTIHFVRTDDRGRFSFDVQQHTGDMLQVSFMGYAKHRQPVDNDNTIRLTRQAFQLKEVKVQGPPVTMRRDTIVYDLTKFTTNRDNDLKDVLKKLPGVDVEKDGQIKYKGQAISRFTVLITFSCVSFAPDEQAVSEKIMLITSKTAARALNVFFIL